MTEALFILLACLFIYAAVRAALAHGTKDLRSATEEAKRAGDELIRKQAEEREKLKAMVQEVARPQECWKCENCQELNLLTKSNCVCGFPRLDAKQYGAKQ